MAADFHDPGRVFAFFAIAAGMDVLGIRVAAAGHPLATRILAGVTVAVWLVLTYGIPASLLLARSHDSVVGDVTGTWLLWVVAAQSLSLVASTLVPAWPSQSGQLRRLLHDPSFAGNHPLLITARGRNQFRQTERSHPPGGPRSATRPDATDTPT